MLNGLTPKTKQIFDAISQLDCIKDYCLIGGTALAIQIGHRLSEDLDFCIWKKSKNDRPEVKWPVIFDELSALGKVQKNILDFHHCDFHVDGVKITFFCNHIKEPEKLQRIPVFNNLVVADPVSIGVMKIEVMQYRTTHRDYYDIYSLLQEGICLDILISQARRYMRYNLKTREIISLLVCGNKFKEEKKISELLPKYNVSINDIERFIIEEIRKMQIPK
jgi:predicted nucleotidyltransferase component of viral defense system